jgi:hypothetical protein
MFVITISNVAEGRVSAHPYLPLTTCNARDVARELSRDFHGSLVCVRDLFDGSLVGEYQDGRMVR